MMGGGEFEGERKEVEVGGRSFTYPVSLAVVSGGGGGGIIGVDPRKLG
jgi:hypothetical protein